VAEVNPLLQQALDLIVEKGWAQFQLEDLADENMSLNQVHAQFPTRLSVLEALGQHIDQSTLDNVDTFDESDSQKDRLFSIMMTRFDVLATQKPIIKHLWQNVWKDPCTVTGSVPAGLKSMTMLLKTAGIETSGILGALRIKTFALFYLNTVWTWLSDDTPDADQTMAALDTNLKRLGQFPQFYGSN
jgi:ubiquinone biosynthesis protein COQ9